MDEAACKVRETRDFSSFSKRNTQVKNFLCTVMESQWETEGDCLVYRIRANRFLRGMVRGLTGTMLQVGRGILTVDGFGQVAADRSRERVNFNVPAHGLFLTDVCYRTGLREKLDI
jgi:tRNA pseudouridine38-40 synthase